MKMMPAGIICFRTTGMLYIWGAIPLRHLLPVNSIATVKADFREGR